MVAANEIGLVDHRNKVVDVVKVCLDKGISVVFVCEQSEDEDPKNIEDEGFKIILQVARRR